MNFKSIMLGAASIAAATGVQAADLPVAPEPIDYVRVCDAYGARFYYIPGTDTCLRVGGRVRAQVTFTNFGSNGNWSDRTTGDGLDFDAYGFLYLDSRTNTEYGLLRTFTEIEVSNTGTAEAVSLGKAYIQFGGLTAGHATSFYDFFTGTTYAVQLSRNWADTTSNLFAYTAAFGNGFSATVSIEDGRFRRVAGGVTYATQKWPDLVANLRVDQGWGSAQIMGALHDARSSTVSGEIGWAVGGGVIIGLPMLGSGSEIAFQAQYADGALAYIGGGTSGFTSTLTLADFDTAGTTSKGFSISGGIYHQATSNVGLALDASYMDIDQSGVGTFQDVTQFVVGASAVWSPVSGFDVGVGFSWASPDVGGGIAEDDALSLRFRVQRTF